MSDPASEIPKEDPAESISAWKLAIAVMMAGIVIFIGFILLRLVQPTNWAFTVEATTEIVEVKMRPDTEVRWLVDGAIVCSRGALELPEYYVARLPDHSCYSSNWIGWRSPDPEQVLRLNGGASATIQLRPQGGLAVSLRSSEDESLGGYSVVGVVDEHGVANEVELRSAVNLIWTEVPQQSLTLPFSGETTLGRAVSWFDTRVLRSGNVVVYTADESADKRKMIDDAELMLGDQVRLAAPQTKGRLRELLLGWLEPRRPWPKGFVYVTGEGGEDTMQVVAFGRAGSIGIERFGESGYDFEPARIRALAADPAVAFWGSILAAYMTLILSLQPFIGGGSADAKDPGNATDLLQRFNRWLRSRPRK
ncbi:MAG: hypothetical protein KJO01_09080 [Gammaproteobacteria bacterium]|nr:hypothetical protein [Gammaproteobacteria bacterium]MBT8110937.1 hypothetical protein [Gammaproteobacteria bacterium]NND47370.1 hypothetical protein [Woeseiaceae bacterium]NNL45635.1 hypothetical protein [Woeseiaceae bacterium]